MKNRPVEAPDELWSDMKPLLLTLGVLAACAEVQDSPVHISRPPPPPVSTPAGPTANPTPEPSGPSVASVPGNGQGLLPRVVINEISGDGDWLELYNAGEGEAALSDLTLAAKAKGADTPDLDTALRFAEGERLAAHGFALIAGKKGTPSSQLQADCLPAIATGSCYAVTFGISDKDGDSLFLLDNTGTIIARVDYPAATVPKGQSWARTSDGSETFAVSAASPAGANAAK